MGVRVKGCEDGVEVTPQVYTTGQCSAAAAAKGVGSMACAQVVQQVCLGLRLSVSANNKHIIHKAIKHKATKE